MKFLLHLKFIIPVLIVWLFLLYPITSQPFVMTHMGLLTHNRNISLSGMVLLSDKKLLTGGASARLDHSLYYQIFLVRYNTTGIFQIDEKRINNLKTVNELLQGRMKYTFIMSGESKIVQISHKHNKIYILKTIVNILYNMKSLLKGEANTVIGFISRMKNNLIIK